MALLMLLLGANLPLHAHAKGDSYRLELITDELVKPVSLTTLADGRLLVTQLDGQVMVVEDGAVRTEPFLNLVSLVTALAGEQGLFSAALEPLSGSSSFGRPPRLIAAYTERDSGDLVVAAFPSNEELTRADESAKHELLRVPMPEPFHHGGQVAFGPDGMLYVSVGNGESANHFLHEQPWSAQDLSLLRGKLLRLALSPPASEAAYLVPDGNPFVNTAGARPEIFALGFRNPWKFTFDDHSSALILSDVGNDRWEEVNLVEAGGNYGWPAREGRECQYLPDAPGLVDPDCASRSFVEPLAVYGHLAIDPAGGQAVTGGMVVHDPALPELAGHYLFSDFVVGRLWSLELGSGTLTLLLDTDLAITQVAEGPGHEVLVLAISGELLRLRHEPD